FEHLIKPGWAASRGSRDDGDGDAHGRRAQPSHSHPGRHPRDQGSPEKLAPPPKVSKERFWLPRACCFPCALLMRGRASGSRAPCQWWQEDVHVVSRSCLQ
uniref:Uncharacterized protein n=1 Tax=Aegilops tauschii subsp. strangulata TaxID=200361 RepID=A0A452Z677_AEGTS